MMSMACCFVGPPCPAYYEQWTIPLNICDPQQEKGREGKIFEIYFHS